MHPLYSCLSAIFKISLELTLFYCTQPYAIMDFDCICLSIHVIKQHVHIHSFLLKTLWKYGTSSHYTSKSVFCRETSGIEFLLSQTHQNTLVYLTNRYHFFFHKKMCLVYTQEVTVLEVFLSIMVSFSALFALAFLSHERSQPGSSFESVLQLVFLCSVTFSISFSTELSFRDQ